MKKTLFSLTFLITLCGNLIAQTLTPAWEISLPGKLKWMQVNDWGILVTACENGLFGVNPSDGEKLWEIPSLTNIKEDNYNIIEGTPLVRIADKGADAKTMIINGLNGEIIFNSEAEQMGKVFSSKIIYEVDGMMVAYSNEDKDGVALFNYLKAEKKWDRSFEKVKGGALQAQPLVDKEGNILYANGKNFYRLNGQTGEVIWQAEAKKNYIDLFTHPQGDVVYAVSGNASDAFKAANREPSALTVSGGAAGKFQIDAFELATGTEMWKKPVSYSKSRYSGVALGQNDFLLLHTLSANVIDYGSGAGLWKKEKIGTGGDRLSGIFPTDKGLIYAVADGTGRSNIYYVDDAGKKLWKRKAVINGDLVYLEQMNEQLFYISTRGTNMINLEDGKLLWEGDKYLAAGNVPISFIQDEDGSYVMYVRGMLVRVVPEAKDWTLITSNFAFQGELPTELRRLPNGYLLTGNQNAMLIGEDGKVIYHKYYEQPEQSFAAKMALGVVGMASSVASFAYGVSSFGYGLAGEMENNDHYRKKAMQQAAISSFTSDMTGGLDALAAVRFGEDAMVNDYKLILTKKDKSIGFMKIDLITGEEKGQIVTADRTPDFAIDAAGDKLFLKSAGQRVACYGL